MPTSLEKWSHLAQVLALPVAVIALAVTTFLTIQQMGLAALSFQGSMIYDALKDTREIASRYHDGKASEGEIFAVMQTVFLEHEISTIPAPAWAVFESDFCMTLRDEHLRNVWEKDNKTYWPKFRTYMDGMIIKAKDQCKGTTP